MGRDAHDPARYRDNDELRYSLRTIERYAPWVRRIHVVTSGHVPPWLDVDDRRIRLVPHDRIFEAADLPTFNSHAIEARLHHIPGLAEHFVYFNDDVFLARYQPSTNYFDPTGAPLVSMTTQPAPRGVEAASPSCDHSAANGARLIERDLGATPLRRPRHGPFALRRSHLDVLEARFGPELAATASHRFRSPSDISLPTFLAPMYGLVSGFSGVSAALVDEVNVDDPSLLAHLAALGSDTCFDSFCLNDTERVPPGVAGPRGIVTAFLQRRFPEAARWELAPAMLPTPLEQASAVR